MRLLILRNDVLGASGLGRNFFVTQRVVVAGPYEVREPGAKIIERGSILRRPKFSVGSRSGAVGCRSSSKHRNARAAIGPTRPLSDTRPPGCLKAKAPSFGWTIVRKKMSSATGGRAPLLTREEGSSLAVGTTPGEARPRVAEVATTRRSRTNGGVSW
jgi:hypothetical protein